MESSIKATVVCQSALAVPGIPLLIWALGDAHVRSLLKESLSVITILIFCQMLVLCFWTRVTPYRGKGQKMGALIHWHTIIGYSSIAIILFHPFFLVLPKFFASGISPINAFDTIITTFNRGVVLGISAWFCMLVLLLTAFMRSRLPMKHTTWRIVHGIQAMLLIVLSTWHVLDLGRHATPAMALYITLLAAGSLLLIATGFIAKPGKHIRRS